ncbi:MAG TPA: VOC family protein [Chitinophagales bacterium]|nr:VOC family protein [Chitinophagales bacterium]
MAVKYIPDGYSTITPFIIVKDAKKFIEYVNKAFNAELKSKFDAPDGKVMHAEIKIGESILMLGEAMEQWPPFPGMLYLYVPDVDATYKQAMAAGGESLREPTTEFYGDRSAGLRDAWGNQWWLATHVEDVSEEEMEKRHKEMAAKQA